MIQATHPHRIARELATRRPGYTLPGAFYRDAEVYEFDLQSIFYRQWLFAGLEAEVPRQGDYFTLEIGPSSVVVLRDKQGAIRAFHNTCRHRGSRICGKERGRSPTLVCPYHQWTYRLDGSLLRAGRMPDDFDKSQHGLKTVHVERLGGTIYICLGDQPPDFSDLRRKIEPLLAKHNLGNAKVAARATLIEHGNWKLVMENSRECYHCPTGHPELMDTLLDTYDLESPEIKKFWAACESKGLENGPVYGHGFRALRLPLANDAVSVTPDGQPGVKKLLGQTGDGDIGSLRWSRFPNFFSHCFGDYAFFFRLLPRGPMETEVVSTFLVNKDAVEGVDYDAESLARIWNITNDQDRQLVEINQLGVNSVGYQPGPYNPTAEHVVAEFADWYVTEAAGALGNDRSDRPMAAE